MTKDELIIEIKTNFWISSRNTLNSKKILTNPILEDLKAFTSFLSEDAHPNERFYCIENNIQEKILCLNKKCNNSVSFSSSGYKNYCSDKCFIEDTKISIEERFKRNSEVIERVDIQELKDFLYENALSRNKDKIKPVFSKKIGLDETSFIYLASLIDHTSFLPQSSSLKERVFCVLKEIVIQPTCNYCGKPTKFVSYSLGYNNYCSPRCASLNSTEDRKLTCMRKFASDNIFGSEVFKEDNKQFWVQNYGVENPSQVPFVKEKKINTSQQNWGTDFYSQSEHCKNNRYRKTFKRRMNLLKNVVLPLFDIDSFDGVQNGKLYDFKCVKCNHIFSDTLDNGNIPRCYVCYPKRTTYYRLEKEISEWLASEGFACKVNKKFYPDKGRRFKELDVFIPSKNFGIEINGIYWHSELSGGKERNYHKNKQDFFKDRGISVFQILDKEWIEKKGIVKSMILSKLGKVIPIGARKCDVRLIPKEEAIEFMDNNHLQGGVKSSSTNIGLFWENNLVQVVSFSKSRFNSKYEYEILRFSTILGYRIIGGFSKILKYFTTSYFPKSIITYADYRYSNGDVYLKNGFNLIGNPSPSYSYIYKKNYNILFNRIKFQKHKLEETLEFFDPELSEWDNMKLNNYDRIWDCGSFTFSKEYSY